MQDISRRQIAAALAWQNLLFPAPGLHNPCAARRAFSSDFEAVWAKSPSLSQQGYLYIGKHLQLANQPISSLKLPFTSRSIPV
jgi:hypothetical protein